MERPTKRARMSTPEDFTSEQLQVYNTMLEGQLLQNTQYKHLVLPTPTIELSQFRPLSAHQVYAKRWNNQHQIVRRAPQVTVSVAGIGIAVSTGEESSRPTQNTGTGDVAETISAIISTATGATSPTGLETHSSITALISGGTTSPTLPSSVNGTSILTGSAIPTFTGTTTSGLDLAHNNGTLGSSRTSSSSMHQTATRTNQLAVTTDSSQSDGSDTDGDAIYSSSTNTWRYGDPVVDSTTTAASAEATQAGIGAASGAATATATSTNEGSGGSSPGVVLTPQQQQVVGGVVGGVAGIAFVLIGLLYFLKWYRQRLKAQGLLSEKVFSHHEIGDGGNSPLVQPGVMGQSKRSSIIPIMGLSSMFKNIRPQSSHTLASTTTTSSSLVAESERSFQKIGGRRIPSVLSTGGDGYGGDNNVYYNQSVRSPVGNFQASPTHWQNDNTTSEAATQITNPFLDPPSIADYDYNSSLYRGPPSFSPTVPKTSTRDFAITQPRSHVNLRGQHSPLSPSGVIVNGRVVNPTNDSFATLRPSPARTPVTQSPTMGSIRLHEPISTPPMMGRDVPDLPGLPPSIVVPRLDAAPKGRRPGAGVLQSDNLAVVGIDGNISRYSASARSFSGISGRSTSTGGKFREEI